VFFTALPSVGQVVTQDESLYSLNGTPVTLLYGSTPAWRTLTEGLSGPDVAQLKADLVSLGYATSAELGSSDYFGSATATAIKAFQTHQGVSATGRLTLGQAVFLPGPARITSVAATLGTPAQAGSTVLQATSTTRQVTATIPATQVAQLHVGESASITLPDGHTTPGTVTSIGAIATGSSSSSGSPAPPTVNIEITPTHPAATGVVDQAPVTLTVTTATVTDVLAVPVTALATTTDGKPAVEVGGGKLARFVAVTVGLFDDANGLVEVHSSALHAGQPVRLPTSTIST
jgi:peptidoglycan hydrolase-like protein with peptidoglycan-binding domain